MAARRTSVNVQRGSIGTKTWRPRPPEVFGQPRMPVLVEEGVQLVSGADRVAEVGARLRVQVDPQLVGDVGASPAYRPGMEGEQPRLAAQTTAATSVGQISSALRPLGKLMRAVGIQSGRFFGARFWKNDSPSTPSGYRSIVVGRLRRARRMPSPTAR